MAQRVNKINRLANPTQRKPARRCPLCGNKTRVLQTLDRANGTTIRYRECLNPHCRYRFSTGESRCSLFRI